jgi:diacylglycerol kinase (ATP)
MIATIFKTFMIVPPKFAFGLSRYVAYNSPDSEPMTRIFVIFNPAARGEKAQRAQRFIEANAGPRVTLAPTQSAGDAQPLAARAVREGYDVIVAAGGDGTINETINGLGESGVPLGVLPLGTVNVFAQELNIPRRLDAAWTLLEAGQIRTIDLACAEAGGRRRYFVQLAGVGFDARAVRSASWELKKKVGPFSYVWAGLKTLGERHSPVEVRIDGAAIAARGFAVFVGNGRFYGGPFRLFPRARLDDGLLDVCVFERGAVLDLLRYSPRVLFGTHERLRGVQYFQTRELICQAAEPTPFQLDGEDAGDSPVRFSIRPRALRVLVPAANRAQSGSST